MSDRRSFLFGSLGAVLAGSVPAQAIEFGKELKSGDVTLVMDRPDHAHQPDELLVAVSTTNKEADHALVQVFYRTTREIEGRPVKLLVHQESVAPLVGGALGATNQNFYLPRDEVQFVRVTLFQTVGETKEFR